MRKNGFGTTDMASRRATTGEENSAGQESVSEGSWTLMKGKGEVSEDLVGAGLFNV